MHRRYLLLSLGSVVLVGTAAVAWHLSQLSSPVAAGPSTNESGHAGRLVVASGSFADTTPQPSVPLATLGGGGGRGTGVITASGTTWLGLARLSVTQSPDGNVHALLEDAGCVETASWFRRWLDAEFSPSAEAERDRWVALNEVIIDENVPTVVLLKLGKAIRYVKGATLANIVYRRALNLAPDALAKTSAPSDVDALRRGLVDARYSLWQEKDWEAILRQTDLELQYETEHGRRRYLAMHFKVDALRFLNRIDEAVALSERVLDEYRDDDRTLTPAELGDIAWQHAVILLQANRQPERAAQLLARSLQGASREVIAERAATMVQALILAGRPEEARQWFATHRTAVTDATRVRWIEARLSEGAVRTNGATGPGGG